QPTPPRSTPCMPTAFPRLRAWTVRHLVLRLRISTAQLREWTLRPRFLPRWLRRSPKAARLLVRSLRRFLEEVALCTSSRSTLEQRRFLPKGNDARLALGPVEMGVVPRGSEQQREGRARTVAERVSVDARRFERIV